MYVNIFILCVYICMFLYIYIYDSILNALVLSSSVGPNRLYLFNSLSFLRMTLFCPRPPRARGERRCGTSSTSGKARTPSTTRTRSWWPSSWARCSSCCWRREPTTRSRTRRTSGTCFTRSWTISTRSTYSPPPPPPSCILDTRMDCLVRVMDSSFPPPPLPVLRQCFEAGH